MSGFPKSPKAGDLATPYNGYLYKYSGTKWERASTTKNVSIKTNAAGGVDSIQINGQDAYALKRRGNIGLRVFGGRMQFPFDDGGVAKTHHCVMTTALPFDAVQVVLSACNTAAIPVTSLAVSTLSSAAAVNNNSATWIAGTFSGATSANIPARLTSRRRTYLISDIIPISSVPRTDGGTYPLLAIRAYLGTPGIYTLLGDTAGTLDLTPWATKSDGRIHVMRYNDGDCITAPSNFTSAVNRSTSPIVGLIYYARGRVINVCGFGDSITEGPLPYVGAGWGYQACSELSAETGTAYEWSNFAWSGSEMTGQPAGGIAETFDDAININQFPIDIATIPVWSPNDIVSLPITAAAIDSDERRPSLRMIASASKAGIGVVAWTGLPTNPNVKNYGGSDSLRTAHNSNMRTILGKICPVADFEPILSGSTDANGQVNMLAGSTSDGIHPNATVGVPALVPEAKRAILKFY